MVVTWVMVLLEGVWVVVVVLEEAPVPPVDPSSRSVLQDQAWGG